MRTWRHMVNNKMPCHLARHLQPLTNRETGKEERTDLRWYVHTKADTRIWGHMLILLTFPMSNGTSHGLLPQPGKRGEQSVGVKNKKPFENKWRRLGALLCVPLPRPCLQSVYSFFFRFRARPNRRQWFAWCDRPLRFPAALFGVCVCMCLCVVVCLWVLMCWEWLPESPSCRGSSKKNTSNGNQGNMHKSAAFKGCHLACILPEYWAL